MKVAFTVPMRPEMGSSETQVLLETRVLWSEGAVDAKTLRGDSLACLRIACLYSWTMRMGKEQWDQKSER